MKPASKWPGWASENDMKLYPIIIAELVRKGYTLADAQVLAADALGLTDDVGGI